MSKNIANKITTPNPNAVIIKANRDSNIITLLNHLKIIIEHYTPNGRQCKKNNALPTHLLRGVVIQCLSYSN